VSFQDQTRHVIFIGRNERVIDNLLKRHISQRELGGHALPLRPSRQSGQLVAGLLFIGFGENLSQVTELKALWHFWMVFIIRRKAKGHESKEEITHFLMPRFERFRAMASLANPHKISLFLLAFIPF